MNTFTSTSRSHLCSSGHTRAVIDASIHGYKLISRGFIFDVWVVQGSVEHDDGECENITRVHLGSDQSG